MQHTPSYSIRWAGSHTSHVKIVLGEKAMSEPSNKPGRGSPPRIPGWVKAFLIVLIVIVAVVVIVHLMGIRFDHGGGGTLPSGLVSLLENAVEQI
jgi:hypothetical protein